MPPPAPPTPHRFLTGTRKKGSPTKEPRPARTLRHDAPQVDPDLVTPLRRSQPPPSPAPAAATQFSRTPRFSHAARRPEQSAPLEPPAASFVQALRSETRREDVEDDARPYEDDQGDEDDEMLLGNDALPTTELDDAAHLNRAEGDTMDLPFSPKRRRVEARHSPDDLSQPHPLNPLVFKPPPDPSTLHQNGPTPRFAPPSTPARQTPAPDVMASRPAFLRPTPAPAEASEPLPEAFSPHRRGQKFVPGGMAATLQQWVVETGQAAAQSRRGQGYLRGEEWVLKVWVEEVEGEGVPWMVKGRMGDSESVRLLLTGVDGGAVEKGRTIGVRAPCWQVDIEGEGWWVGVDWREVG